MATRCGYRIGWLSRRCLGLAGSAPAVVPYGTPCFEKLDRSSGARRIRFDGNAGGPRRFSKTIVENKERSHRRINQAEFARPREKDTKKSGSRLSESAKRGIYYPGRKSKGGSHSCEQLGCR